MRALMLLPPSCSYCANLVYGLLGKRVRRKSASFLSGCAPSEKKMQLTWELAELHILGKDVTSKKESCKIFSKSAKQAEKVLISYKLQIPATQHFDTSKSLAITVHHLT